MNPLEAAVSVLKDIEYALRTDDLSPERIETLIDEITDLRAGHPDIALLFMSAAWEAEDSDE